MQLRSRTTSKSVAPLKQTTPKTRQKKKFVASFERPVEPVMPEEIDHHINDTAAHTYVSLTGKLVRFATPTTTELATIPSDHVTPQSAWAPLSTSTSDRIQALGILGKMMGNRLPPDQISNYEAMISDLARRGVWETAVLKQHRLVLKTFLENNSYAIPVHNRFARMYNRQFGGQYEHFHLPVYDDPQSIRKTKIDDDVKESKQVNPCLESTSGASSHHNTSGASATLPVQLDGPMDAESTSEQRARRINDRSGFYQAECSRHMQQGGFWGRENIQVAEEDGDKGTEGVYRRVPTLKAVREHVAQMKRLKEATEKNTLIAHDALQKFAASAMTARRQRPAHELDPAHLASAPSKEVYAATDEEGASAQQAGLREGGDAWMTDVVLDNCITGNGMEGKEGKRNDRGRLTPFSSDSGPITAFVASASPFQGSESARSYLAWLHHRQTRFPTIAPNYPECILIAKDLGRYPAKVFDEIIYHWGFETGNYRSEWYKQNRATLLGEDPRFDEESMGRWNAWLKQGRDMKEKRKF